MSRSNNVKQEKGKRNRPNQISRVMRESKEGYRVDQKPADHGRTVRPEYPTFEILTLETV